MNIVPGAGRLPNPVLLCGESPGKEEFHRGEPFVGKSGIEQQWYLSRHKLTARHWYRTNVVKEYIDGNPDPTVDQIAFWSPTLTAEITACQPKLIIAVGRFAAQWFLGDDADLESCHGLPHRGGEFDSTRKDRAQGAAVLPIYHPAFGFYSKDAKTVINWDYGQVAYILDLIEKGKPIPYREDPYAGREQYLDITGHDLGVCLSIDAPSIIGLDTEGTPDRPWSVQVSTSPGTAYVLRCSQPDFQEGINALQYLVDRGCTVVTHDAGTPAGCLYDTQMCRAMGLNLTRAHQRNTMYRAYLLRTEPKGLKALSWRWLGMQMTDYMGLVGNIGRDKQVAYLHRILEHADTWPNPEPRLIHNNDGTSRLYKPQSIPRRVESILKDISTGKVNKYGEPCDPWKRWQDVDVSLKSQVETILGPMPQGSLDDVDPARAIYYAGRDADATLRLYHVLTDELRRRGTPDALAETGESVLPIFEEMQHHGMPASRSKFQSLHAYVQEQMTRFQSQLTHKYFGGRPFNPASSKQVAKLMEMRGLKGEKNTKSGSVSTSKKSIEHLRHSDPAMALVIDWREHQKISSTYCEPLLAIADRRLDSNGASSDQFLVHTKLKPVSVTTRRLAAEDPSLLNQPTRTELGRRVRDCYQTQPPETFGAWDFSGQEMRVAAHVSGDRLLCRLFVEGRDPHAEAATRIFGVTEQQVGKDKFKFEYRLPAKTANFGILYGLTGGGLVDLFRMFGLSWSEDRCQELIEEILTKIYPGLQASINDAYSSARSTDMIRDLFGMPRYLPMIWSRNQAESHEAGRQAFSHVIQGTAQGMMQSSMAWLNPHIHVLEDAGLNVKWTLQIHDEIILRFDEWLWESLDPLVMEALTCHHGIKLRVPIEAEGHKSTTWAGLK